MHQHSGCESIHWDRVWCVCEHASMFSSMQYLCKTSVSLIFCLVCFNWHMCNVKWHILPNSEEQASNQILKVSSWNGTYYLTLKSRQATKYSRFHQDTKVGGVWWFWTQHDAHWNAHYMNNTKDHYTYISLCGYLLGNRQPSPEAHLHCCWIFSCTLVSGSS